MCDVIWHRAPMECLLIYGYESDMIGLIRISIFSVLLLSACKVQVETPSGGSVTTVSGNYTCNAGQKCVVEVNDLSFDEAFVVVPKSGMRFVSWKKRPDGLFGGSGNPEIGLSTSWFGGYEIMMDILNSDKTFYIEPVFEQLPSYPTIAGGSPSSTAKLSLLGRNRIETNSFYNYFSYRAEKSEKLILQSTLAIPLSDTEKARCASNEGTGSSPSSYDTQIHIYDKNLNRIGGRCGEGLIFEFPEAGDYIIQFDYPGNGSGYGYAAPFFKDNFIQSPIGGRGAASNPKSILTHTSNVLESNPFYNFYRYTADAGDRITLSTNLDRPLSTQQKTRCASNPGTGAIPSSYDTQIHVYDMSMNRVGGNCGENLTFTFPKSGTYVINFAYAMQSAGFFNAAIIK